MILVTGATGILGRVVVLELLKNGKEVRACKRPNSNIADVKKSFSFYTDKAEEYFEKINWIDLDFRDIYSLNEALEGISEVYHCAGKVSFHPNDKESLYENNIVFTRELLYACQNSSVKSFCHISSTAVLDDKNEQGELDEESNYNPKIEHSAYAVSKHFSEMEVWRASAEGVKTVILNPGVIIGSGNWKSSSGKMFEAFAKYPYAMSGSTAYVDVRDVAKIAVDLMEKNSFEKRYIIISETKKIAEVANYIREKLGKSKVKILSKSILNFGYLLNILFGWLFPKLRMMSKVNLETVTSHHIVTNEKIKKELNYQFTPVFESIDFHLNNYISDHKK
jgi:dihydroflavonol-4-reductase